MRKATFISALVLTQLACGAGEVREGGVRYAAPKQIGTLDNARINESSGLACSRRTKGVFWTHNDSGDAPRVYAVARNGKTLATLNVAGAKARDWEDMASFVRGDKAYLLLADAGDNARRRRDCRLYVVPEPEIDTSKARTRLTAKPEMVIRYAYSDGPKDCEGVAVDPEAGKIYLLSKRENPRKLYELKLPKAAPEEPLTARPIAKLRIGMTTGMDMSPDGLRAVICTYTTGYEYVRGKDQTWAKALASGGRRVALPIRRGGESICYGPGGRSLYLTREGKDSPLWEVAATEPAATQPEKPAP